MQRKPIQPRRLCGRNGLPLTLAVSVIAISPALCGAGRAPSKDNAVQVPLPDGWQVRDYAWLTDQRLIVRYESGPSSAVAVLDPTTGRTGSIDVLQNAPALHSLTRGGRSLFPSPDGRWLVVAPGGSPVQPSWIAFDTANGQHVTWAGESGGRFAGWLPDGSAWIEWAPGDGKVLLMAHRLDVRTPDGMKDGAEYTLPVETMPAYTLPAISQVVGCTSQDRLLFAALIQSPPGDDGRGRTLVEYRLGEPAEAVSTRKVLFDHPIYSHIIDVSLSPDRKHLCWLVVMNVPPPKQRYGRLPDRRAIGPFMCLWTSAANGQGLRMVHREPLGEEEFVSAYRGGPDHVGPQQLEWSPDGKRVSYQSGGRLWTVTIGR